MNRTLKETLAKLALETGGDWVTLLPFALFRAHNTPYKLNLTPFEIVYGGAPSSVSYLRGKNPATSFIAAVPKSSIGLKQGACTHLDFTQRNP